MEKFNILVSNQTFLEALQNDIFVVDLTIIGITISVFTLLFSFISNKHQIVVEMKEKINNGELDPIFKSRFNMGLKYITKLGNLGRGCFRIFVLSVILLILSWVNLRLFDTNLIFLIVNLVLLLTISIYATVILSRVYYQFRKERKT